jgi:CheY-like chemotaxis protein
MSGHPLIILIADDAAEIRHLITIALCRHGHRVVGCPNGEEAVKLATAEPFDVIVLDVNMPVLDGVSAAQRLRMDPATGRVPLLCISAADPGALGHEGQPLFDRFMPKPLSPRELVSLVHEVAGSRAS